jgi:ABC-type Fe3+-hydroxamate transport system substrate-binding protein
MKTVKRFAAVALAGSVAFGLAACGTTEEAATPDTTTPAGTPVTVTDSRGVAIELDSPAVDVVGTEWNVVENLVSLGVMPVGAADPAGYADYVGAAPLDDTVTDIGTRGTPSIDTLATLAPDLIVATDDLTEDVIAQLEDVAPTLVVTSADASDQIGQAEENLDLIAQATGTEDAAEQLLADYDAAVADAAEAVTEAGLEGATVALADGYVYEGATTIRPFVSGSYMADVLAEVGLESPWEVEGDPAYGLASIDVEGLTGLETDFLVLLAATPDLVSTLEANDEWNTLPAVESGNALMIDDAIWTFGGPASAIQAIDVLTGALGQ